eukprot:s972_g5.t1
MWYVVARHAGSAGTAVPEDFCSWVGELNAQICASDGLQASVQWGAWDKRLPLYFWGSAYTKFLTGEAQRAARIFHAIAADLARRVGGKVEYRDAPNKQPSRVVKKQFDYASPGLTLLHEALDLMKGKFRRGNVTCATCCSGAVP